jgi:Cys-tRNA(Pro)/Cys-tRNA(Cys) deacylase
MHPRIIEAFKNTDLEYKIRNHANLGSVRGPDDVAAALGYDISRITKTLFLQADGENKFFLIVAPMGNKVDLKLLAELMGVRRLKLASKEDLNDQLGYPMHGVSPLGAQDIPVYIDSSLIRHDTVLVGAGEMGQEIELSPHKLQELTNATLI